MNKSNCKNNHSSSQSSVRPCRCVLTAQDQKTRGGIGRPEAAGEHSQMMTLSSSVLWSPSDHRRGNLQIPFRRNDPVPCAFPVILSWFYPPAWLPVWNLDFLPAPFGPCFL
ncbi:hypothetical protein EYF80_023981 [Liparis tanakae]|uniref:Uncharacterized protein n=1 Tax=Liparis tanakae TaxID=230148 RepID=A0A4Z2HIT9_9TELE|nr:hypothetical protein EYF80_023981 [Liparis tanakae]